MGVGQNRYPKWNPGRWKQGLKSAVFWWFNFDPYPYSPPPSISCLSCHFQMSFPVLERCFWKISGAPRRQRREIPEVQLLATGGTGPTRVRSMRSISRQAPLRWPESSASGPGKNLWLAEIATVAVSVYTMSEASFQDVTSVDPDPALPSVFVFVFFPGTYFWLIVLVNVFLWLQACFRAIIQRVPCEQGSFLRCV